MSVDRPSVKKSTVSASLNDVEKLKQIRILNEISSTESIYIHGIEKLSEHLTLIKSLLHEKDTNNKNIRKLDEMIYSLETILSLHKDKKSDDFYLKMKKDENPKHYIKKIVDYFNHQTNIQRAYIKYINQYAMFLDFFNTMEDIEKLLPKRVGEHADLSWKQIRICNIESTHSIATSASMQQASSGVSMPERINILTIESLLITPIQRILRYALLLQELSKTLGDNDKNKSLAYALASIKKTADIINEEKRNYEFLIKIEPIIKTLEEYIKKNTHDFDNKENVSKATLTIILLKDNKATITSDQVEQLSHIKNMDELYKKSFLIHANKNYANDKKESSLTIEEAVEEYCNRNLGLKPKSIKNIAMKWKYETLYNEVLSKIIEIIEIIYAEKGNAFTKKAHSYIIETLNMSNYNAFETSRNRAAFAKEIIELIPQSSPSAAVSSLTPSKQSSIHTHEDNKYVSQKKTKKIHHHIVHSIEKTPSFRH